MKVSTAKVRFGDVMVPNRRPYTLGPTEDADLVGMRWYGEGPFHRELKPAEKIRKKSHFRIRAGDVIYNKLFAWKGAFGVVPPELDGMFVSDKFPTYELDRSRVDDPYLRWFFRHPGVWEEAREMSTGSAAVSKLTLNPPKFLELGLPLPSLAKQKLIVAQIEAVAEKLQRATLLHRESAKRIEVLDQATVSQVLGHLPVEGTLGDVLLEKPRNGWSPSCEPVGAGVPVLTLSAVTGFDYDRSAIKYTLEPTAEGAHYWLEPGDLLVTRSNAPELVGHAAIYDGTPSPCIYPDLMMRLRLDPDKADTRFVWMWLQTSMARDHIRLNAKGTSPTMKKISQAVVCAIPFPVGTPLSEQVALVQRLSDTRQRSESVRAMHDRVGGHLDSLIPAVLHRVFQHAL